MAAEVASLSLWAVSLATLPNVHSQPGSKTVVFDPAHRIVFDTAHRRTCENVAWQLRENGLKGRSKGREFGRAFLQNSSPIHRLVV